MRKILGDHFELIAEAARGGMGAVYRGRDIRTGQMVAVKVLELVAPSDHARFERECSLLAGLQHPNIVRYVAHGSSSDGTRYLVQEWIDGITLATQIQTIGLHVRDAVKVAIGISDALADAHSHGVVHRDVKPANIILDKGDPDRIKLVDFGIARMEADSGVLTRAGVLVGTPSYMAPEQARGSVEITPAADVWALGCVLYEAACGRKAFAGRTHEAIRAKSLLHEPPRLDSLAPEVGTELADYVHDMLAKQISDRPATGADVAVALRRLLPRVPAGPVRRANQPDTQATKVEPRKPAPGDSGPRCFIMVTLPPADPAAPPRAPVNIDKICERHHLTMHPLSDGSVLLEASGDGEASAASVAYAAMEIQAEVFDGAVSVFGQAYEEPMDQTIDRGANSLAEVTMASMFAEAVGAEPLICVDDVIAEMLRGEGITVITTENGHALRAAKQDHQ